MAASAGNNPPLDVINAPFVAVFGRDLVGGGLSIGAATPIVGGTREGVNTALLGGSLPFVGNLGDGGFLSGNGGDAAELAGTAGVYDGGNAFLFGSGTTVFGRRGAGTRRWRHRRKFSRILSEVAHTTWRPPVMLVNQAR